MKCRNCNKSFKPSRPNQSVCSAKCAYGYVLKTKEKAWKKRKKVIKENVKTLTEHRNDVQKIINKIIRTIDSGYTCISCGDDNPTDAGHYRSRGSYPELRYDPFNIFIQCRACNGYKGGQPIEFREGLIDRYGKEFVESIIDTVSDFNKFDSGNIQELKKVAKKYLKTLDSDKLSSVEETLLLRQNLYEKIKKI